MKIKKIKWFPLIINTFLTILSYFIIKAIPGGWIKKSILFVVAIDTIIACNLLFIYGLKNIINRVIAHKKSMTAMVVIELGCIWMCIYKYMTIINHPIYLKFQYLIYLLIMSAIFWFFVFVFLFEIKFWKFYPILGLTFGLIFMLTIPLNVVPDEPVHLMTAYKVSNQFLQSDKCKGNYLYGRADDMNMPIVTNGYNIDSYSNYLTQFNAPLRNPKKTKLSVLYYLNTFQYQYYLSGLGITVGRLLNLNPIRTFLLGRFFNLLFFVSIISLAIYKTPKGKLIMMVLALTPISLQQGMSYSYDAIVIPLCFLISALSLKLYSKDFHKLDYLILLCATALLIPTKQFAYLPFALIPWIYLIIKRFSFKHLMVGISLIIVAGVICYALINQNLVPVSIKNMLANRKYVAWAKSYSYSLLALIKDPVLSLKIIAATVYQHTDFYLNSMIGKDLGWFEIVLPVIYPAFISLITLAVLFDKEKQENSKVFWLNAILMIALTILFIYMGMLISWTPKNYLAIEGVQGRYLIAIVPLILIFISDKIKLQITGNQIKSKLIVFLLIILTISSDGIMVFMNR